MIRITRTRDADALKGYTGAPLQTKLGKLLKYYYEDGTGTVDFKPKARQAWGKAKAQLKKESFNKCAYCEADTAVVAHGDVEHFRPKSEYWWLAYCFDNYTYSCQICNQSFKGNKFDITGNKLPAPKLAARIPTDATKLAEAIASLCPDPATATEASIKKLFSLEDAHLVNPYIEDPERYFAWKAIPATKEVVLVPKGTSTKAKRAVKTAEIALGLNREELRRGRWQAFEALETMVLGFQAVTDQAKKREILQRIRLQAEGNHPYSGMKRYFLKTWGLLPA